jgi:hypothetical protein
MAELPNPALRWQGLAPNPEAWSHRQVWNVPPNLESFPAYYLPSTLAAAPAPNFLSNPSRAVGCVFR